MPACEWACRNCGDAYYGTPPDSGLCEHCQAVTGDD